MKKSILKLCDKKLNIFERERLSLWLLNLPYDDTTRIKSFLDAYYKVDSLPLEFYKLFMYNVNSNRYKELFNILLTKNIYSLINFLKGEEEKVDSINFITPNDYFNLPNKQIKNIFYLLKNMNLKNDDLQVKKNIAKNPHWLLKKDSTNTDSEFLQIAIKLYLSIGFDNSVDLLSGKYGEVDYEIIYYLFNSLIIEGKNNSFIEFLFGNKKDPNNPMKLMLDGKFTELFINFDYFYNSIEYFIDKLGSKLSKSKVSVLLKEKYIAKNIENPEITGDVLDDMISSYYNKYGITDSEEEIIDKNMEAYNLKLKTKTKSSIMKVDIPKINGFTFEMLPLNDIRNLVMGYRSGNCFRLNGDAFILFNKFLTNPHMRILSISTDEYKDFGMVLLMRNGNVLIAQGIEVSKRVPNDITGKKLYDSVKLAIKCLMDEMNKNDDEIVASIIGLSNSNTALYNNSILPFIINPVLEDNHQFYNGVANYQGLLYLKDNKNLKDIKLFVPNKFYSDNNKIYKRSKNTNRNSIEYREIEKILVSLRFARSKKISKAEMIYYYSDLMKKNEDYTICTLDWFIMVFDDGSIDTFINSENSEVISEYEKELEKTKNIIGKRKVKKL